MSAKADGCPRASSGECHSPRACLKNHSCHLYNDAIASYSPLCVIFAPNSVNIARYASFIRHKSPTNCDAHLTESIFQTRSSRFCEVHRDRQVKVYRLFLYGKHMFLLCKKYFIRLIYTKRRQKGIPDSPMRVLQAHYSRTFHRALRKFFPCLFQYGGKCVPKINRPT